MKEWYIPENSKIVFSLSANASRCIDNDRITFANSEDGVEELSDFVIRLMENFAPYSETAIKQCIAKKIAEYDRFSLTLKPNAMSEILRVENDKLVEKARERLCRRSESGTVITRRFNCSKKVKKAFEYSCIAGEADTEIYGGCPSYFVRVLLEEYAELPVSKRERYYFDETWIQLVSAAENGKCLELAEYSRVNRRDKRSRTEVQEFRPFELIVDPITGYNYVLGMGRQKQDASLKAKSGSAPWKVQRHRLTNIVGLRDSAIVGNMPLTKEEKEAIYQQKEFFDIASIGVYEEIGDAGGETNSKKKAKSGDCCCFYKQWLKNVISDCDWSS